MLVVVKSPTRPEPFGLDSVRWWGKVDVVRQKTVRAGLDINKTDRQD